MKRIKTGGFTLVELLVVISIIALLLSILMPALQKVRGMSNVKHKFPPVASTKNVTISITVNHVNSGVGPMGPK